MVLPLPLFASTYIRYEVKNKHLSSGVARLRRLELDNRQLKVSKIELIAKGKPR